MIRNTLIISAALLNVFLHFDYAFPCSCVPPSTPTEELEKSDAVFTGRVIELSVETIRSDSVTIFLFHNVKFEVIGSWKGVDVGQVTLLTPFHTTACGFPLKKVLII